MGMTWSEYKAYREKKKKEEEQTKKQQKASSSKAEKTITNNANNQEKNNNLINTISQNNRLPLNNENANKIASNTPSLQEIVSKNNSSKIVQSNNNPLAKQIEEQNANKPLQKAIEEQKKKPKTTQKEPSTWERIMDNFRIGGYGGITGVAQTGYRDIRDIDNMYTDASSLMRHQVLSTFFGEHGENFARAVDDKLYKWNNDRNQVYNYALDTLNKEQQTNKQNIQQNIEAVKQSGDKVGTKFAELAPSVGNNAMGLLAGTVNPALAFTYYKGSSEASYYDDALQRGMTEDQAKVYSKLMSYVEAGTETISAGNILKGGKAIKAVASGAKNIGVKEGLKAGFNVFKESAKEETANALKQGLKSYGIGIAEEFFQEAITEPIQEFTAMKVAGEDKADWNNMWQRMLQSGVDGALSSAILAGANMGISSCQGIVTKVQNGQEFTTEEYNTAIKDASEKVDVGKMTTDGIKNQVEKLKTEMQQSQNGVNKDINQENKMPQNQFSQEQNTKKEQTKTNLAKVKQFYDENTYNQMQEFIETAPNEQALNQINEDLKTETKNKLEEVYKSENFKESQNRRKNYAQYQRQNNTNGIQYNSDVVNNALDTVASNRNGRRTVGQWKQVAEQIGLNSTDLTKAQIDDIAYGSWFDLQPNKNITQYDNRSKEHKGFEKFTSDDWINTIYESAKGQKLQKLDTVLNQNIANNQEMLYNNITLGEVKNIPTEEVMNFKDDRNGGHRTQEQYEKLKQDIEENGIKNPIELVRNNDGSIEIENGNHRLQVANELGIKEVPVKFVESWDNIGIDEDSSESKIIERMEAYNDRNNKDSGETNLSDGRSRIVEGDRIDNRNESENRETATRDVEIYRGKQEDNNKSSGDTTFKENTKELEESSSFNLQQKPSEEEILSNIYKNVVNRQSKDNQKNNDRIKKYLEEKYPNYKISFTNFKQDGTVKINNIESNKEYNHRLQQQETENAVNRQKVQEEREKNAYKKTPINKQDEFHLEENKLPSTQKEFDDLEDIRNKVEELVESYKETGENISFEKSKSSADAMYIEMLDSNGEPTYKIRIANHYKNGVSGQADYNIHLSEYTSKTAVLKDVNNIIKQIKNIDNKNLTDNPDIRYSKQNQSWQDYLEKNDKSEGTTTDLRDIRLPMKEKQEVKLPMKQENTKIKFDNEVIKTNSEIKGNSETTEKIAKILSEPTKNVKPEQRTWAILKANFIDKGAVFEKISQKTNNRDLQGKYDYTLTAGARGQYAIGNDRYVYSNGKKTLQSKSLTSIMDEVGENTQAFNEYMYHQLNVDRMTLDERFGIENKPVFGESITADISRAEIAKIEEQHPEFKEYANDVYKYLEANKQELVDRGVISQETSDFFKERYPHYVPIQRATRKGNSIDVALDTKRTGINSPIKKAKGGNQDINPLFQTMASQTLQTYRASARNNFGLELKNTLQQMNQLNENRAIADIDDIVDTMTNEEQNNELLQPGKKGENPTFTVFEDGKKITYDISQDMYDALKPKSEILNKLDNTKLAKAGRKISNFRRGVLTEYNPIFSITNAIKDAQDVLINSQHSAKTYAKFPEAYAQIVKKGYWYNEYIQNGGEQNSYFTEGDFENIKKTKLDKAKNVLKIPFEKISSINNVIEMAPRLAEYIVSRQNGANIETAMLDASRVTTNFKAGGDITKFANRNGATFLNASVQGFQQQVRNIQEANMKGLKGWTNLALKYTVAGLPALLLNNLFWDDDDDYEQLQDYVKDNYYVVAKLPNGNFLRIPKGRMVATIQKVVSNANDFVKDGKINSDDVASTIWNDLKEDVSFGMDNLAPNNPIDNNILSPIIQVAQNKTWYGDDLVPQRLQDVPEEEQADETTDKFSKWLGEKLKVSPIKINYLLDQYSGGIGDVLLPLGTPQAENNVIEDKFTTDPVMKSQYPADFFNKRDELNVRNNSLKATDEDKLKYKYISSIQSNISDLYKQKREIQASDKTDKEKKAELKKVQKQINELARESLETVDKVEINGNGAKIGEQEYYKKNGTWTKLTEKEKEKLRNTSMSTYSSYQSQISGKDLKDYEKIQILRDSNYSNEEKSNLYEKTISTDKYYSTLKKSGIDINEYMDYKLAQSNGKFTADKKNGKTVMGSGKKKVLNYLNKNITGYGNRLLIAGKQYSLTDSQRKDLSDYINKTFATQAERTKVYEQLKLNFVVNGNRVTYK